MNWVFPVDGVGLLQPIACYGKSDGNTVLQTNPYRINFNAAVSKLNTQSCLFDQNLTLATRFL